MPFIVAREVPARRTVLEEQHRKSRLRPVRLGPALVLFKYIMQPILRLIVAF